MTYLGTLLKIYVRDHGIELRAIARAIGRHPSQLTRICQGVRCYLPPEVLTALAQAVTSVPDEQANLIVAYLLDQCPSQFRGWVIIENRRADDADPAGPPDARPVACAPAPAPLPPRSE